MNEKRGIPLVQEAVTFAAQLLSTLKMATGPLDSRDKQACEQVQRMLEKAEKVLYGQ